MVEFKKILRFPVNRIKDASKILSRAFHCDPVFTSLLPDNHTRTKSSKNLFRYVINQGIRYGEVYTYPKIEGISIWYPPENIFISTWNAIKAGALKLPFKVKWKYLALQNKIYKHNTSIHKNLVPYPHWYLSLVGVDPEFQSNGFGSRLLSAKIDVINREHIPIYLETNLEKNVKIYKRLGFQILHKALLPEIEIVQWSMLRNPTK